MILSCAGYQPGLLSRAFLAPDLVEMILDGRQPRDLTAEWLSKHLKLPAVCGALGAIGLLERPFRESSGKTGGVPRLERTRLSESGYSPFAQDLIA